MKILSNHKKAVFARIVLDFIYNTNSKVVEGRENIINEINLGKSVILCVWHARLLSVVHNLKNEKVNALAGTHQDADIISRVAASWGWNMIRGSSKEKGDIAYRKIFKILREKQNIFFITPDGPTGPPKNTKIRNNTSFAKNTDKDNSYWGIFNKKLGVYQLGYLLFRETFWKVVY